MRYLEKYAFHFIPDITKLHTFPNKNINLHMLRKYIPDKHSAPWAKRVSSTQQPLVFAVTDQSEAGAAGSAGHSQSEASNPFTDQSEARDVRRELRHLY